MQDPKQFLTEKMNQEPGESKKFIYAMIGMTSLLFIWVATLIAMVFKPDLAGNVVSLAQIALAGVLAITTTLLTGQAVFEYKAMSTIQTVDTNDKEEKKATLTENKTQNVNYDAHIVEEGGQNAPKIKPFGQLANHDMKFDI